MNIVRAYKWTFISGAFILLLLLLPSQLFPKTPQNQIGLDKVVHAFLFGAMTAVFSAEHRAGKKVSPPFVMSLFVISAFALLTEFCQVLTHTRHFDVRDWGADIIGILIALLAMRLVAHLSAHP